MINFNNLGSLGVAVILLTRDCRIPYMQEIQLAVAQNLEHHGDSQRTTVYLSLQRMDCD
jgi:hypothetical protein